MKTVKAEPETRLKSGKENYGYSSEEARRAREYQAGAGRPPEEDVWVAWTPASPVEKSTHRTIRVWITF